MALRVLYGLNTNDLKNIPEVARWAESIGYDGLCTGETAHDPFFPLATGRQRHITGNPGNPGGYCLPAAHPWWWLMQPWTSTTSRVGGSAWVWGPR